MNDRQLIQIYHHHYIRYFQSEWNSKQKKKLKDCKRKLHRTKNGLN